MHFRARHRFKFDWNSFLSKPPPDLHHLPRFSYALLQNIAPSNSWRCPRTTSSRRIYWQCTMTVSFHMIKWPNGLDIPPIRPRTIQIRAWHGGNSPLRSKTMCIFGTKPSGTRRRWKQRWRSTIRIKSTLVLSFLSRYLRLKSTSLDSYLHLVFLLFVKCDSHSTKAKSIAHDLHRKNANSCSM